MSVRERASVARDLIVRLCGFPGSRRSNRMEIPETPPLSLRPSASPRGRPPASRLFYKGSQRIEGSSFEGGRGREAERDEMRAMRFQPLSLSRPSLTAPYPISSRTLSFPFLPCLSVPSLAPFPPPPCSLPSPLSSPCLTAYKTTLECKEGWRFPDRPTDRPVSLDARSLGRPDVRL